MTKIINIESSTGVCSINIAINGKTEIIKESFENNSHSKLLTVFIEKILKECSYSINDIDAISVSKGPGSYTGLRIGVSAAKGLAYAADIPLISVDTLKAMAYGFINERKQLNDSDLFCPMIDARRMEVYTEVFDKELKSVAPLEAKIIDNKSFENLLTGRRVFFFGDGAEKCKKEINHKNALFVSDFNCSAKYMSDLSYRKFLKSEVEDVAYFEPFYLKDFVATIPKKNIYT